MPRRKRSSKAPLRGLGWLGLSALALFALGEVFRHARSETGRLTLARTLGLGDPAQLTLLVGKRLHAALEHAGIPADSIEERLVEGRVPRAVWRVGVWPEASLLQLNYLVTRALEAEDAAVLSGREVWTDHGTLSLRLQVGLPGRATHDVLFVRGSPAGGSAAREPARLALVLFGFGEDAARADSFFALPAPFAVAVGPAAKESRATFRAAHDRSREVVLHLPLEPINYPQVSPGEGTLLVTMKPARIASEVRRFLDQARPLAAVANHMGSLATQDMTLMRAVYQELKRHDLPFFHVTPAAGAVCKSLAADMGVAYGEPDAVVDREARDDDALALERRWRELLDQARARGRLIVWMRATPLTRRWLPHALAPGRLDGVSLAPLSALLHRPAAL